MNVELGKIYHRDDAKKVASNASEYAVRGESGFAAILLGPRGVLSQRDVGHGYLHPEGHLSIRSQGVSRAPDNFTHFLLFCEDFPEPTASSSLKVRELNRKADELIEKAEELKRQAESLGAED